MRLRFLFGETREPDTEHKEVTQEKRGAVKLKPEHGFPNENMCTRQHATEQACERCGPRACLVYGADYRL